MTTRVNLLGMDRQALESFFLGLGEKPFRASQVLKWLHQYGVCDFETMTNISKSLRGKLAELATVELPEVVTRQDSADGTRKWLIRVAGGNCIETVYIPEDKRGTLCISSQVGCPMDCSFCSTAQQGFNRNLDSAEIIAQLRIAADELGQTSPSKRVISNVVFMGMGEPLLNFEPVVSAIRIMLDDHAYGLSKRRVTVSTSGLVPQIDRLRAECPVSLAVSLHAPNDELRNELVPLNRSYPIAILLDACRRYVDAQPHSQITFEYVMLDGINDSDQQARELARVLADIPAKINLIPFNTFPGTRYQASGKDRIDAFRMNLCRAGLVTVTRKTRGDDIDAACGQLAGKVSAKAAKHALRRRSANIEAQP